MEFQSLKVTYFVHKAVVSSFNNYKYMTYDNIVLQK